MHLFLFQLEQSPQTIRLFLYPSPMLREINGAERLVPKTLLAREELLVL